MMAPNEPPNTDVEGIGDSGGALSFGKYQPFATLGRGGMADVFLTVARGPMGFNKLAVVKRLRQALAEEVGFRTMFLDEARLAARLNHPNIVHTYEVGEHNGAYFIAMEFLEGQSLNKVIKEASKRRENIPPTLCARVVAEALSGLHYAHELRDYDGRPLTVIHRDVSPHNVFVTYDGHTKMVDFGIAKAALSSTETEVGVLKGKVAYMSPEQAAAGPIDCRADIFPMGIVLWEMLTGKRLMVGDSAAQTLHRLMNMEIPRVSSVMPEIDPMLDEIVARSLQKDPGYRFQTAAEFRDALEAYIARSGMAARQDDVSRLMLRLFGKVKEEVQRQVQKHMATITRANSTQELQHLNAQSLKRLENSGAHVSGSLLKLGTSSGSGSGIVSNYPPAFDPQQSAFASPPPQQSNNKSAMLLIFAGILFVIALGLGAFALYKLRSQNVAGGGGTDPSAVALGPNGTAGPNGTVGPSGTAGSNGAGTGVTSGTTAAGSTASAQIEIAKPPPTGVATKPPVPWQGGRPQPPRPQPTQQTPSAQPTVTPPPQDEPGYLTMVTYPWTRVTIAGKTLTTPFNKVALPPGTYNAVLENPDQGIKQTMPITIKSGEATTKNLSLK
jgi:serine/threonine-protein kinase